MTLQIDNDTLNSETKAAVSLAIENLATVCSSETTADEAYVALTQLNKKYGVSYQTHSKTAKL